MAAEVDTFHNRPPEPINITVLKIRNLAGSKGDSVNAYVKLEFGDKTLGESPKQEIKADTPAEFNFSVSLLCTYDDPIYLDEIIHKPVVVSILEVLAKEKKSKDDKTNILGQCCLDLLPLMKGSTDFLQSLQITSATEIILDTVSSHDQKPEVDIRVTVSEPLLDEFYLNNSNMMTMSVGSLYSPPESWNITGSQFNYIVGMPVPLSGDREMPVLFFNGKLKPSQDKEGPKKQKRWAVPGTSQGNSALIPDRFMFTEAIENEDGDCKGKDDIDHRKISEQEKNRVTWNMERRCYLQPSAVKSFQTSIAKNYYWPVEIIRYPQLPGKGKKDEEAGIGFHGLAFMNLSPLLYPGVTCVKGAFKVIGFSDAVLLEKAKRHYGVSEDFEKFISAWLSKVSSSPSAKKGLKEAGKQDVKKALQGPTASQMNQLKSESGLEEAIPQNIIEGAQYAEAKTYIMLEVCLDKPIIAKRSQEVLVKKVAELIPPRPLFPKRTDRAQKAVEDFHSQVANIASLLLDEFRGLFGDELKETGPQSNEAMDDRRQKLVYELNSSGKYFAIKEQLKHSVVKIVREKYLRTVNFEDKQELQTFLSELYVYLIDQMHVSLGRFLALEDQPPVPKPLTDSSQLKYFALEAEMNQNVDLAATYYKERIARNRNDADCWFDFGTFNLYINDITKAEECFKECLSINQKHLHGLLLHGVVSVLSEGNETAETLFEAATCLHPKSVLAWTMLGLFYDAVSNEIGAEMAYTEANRLNQANMETLAQALRDEEEELREEKRREKAKMSAEAMQANEGGLSVLPDADKKSETPPILPSGKSKAVETKTGKAITRPVSHYATAGKPLLDTIVQLEGSAQQDMIPKEFASIPTTSIFMEAVDWLLEVKAFSFAERALGHELLTCPGGPNIAFHTAMAKLYIQKGEYSEAENSLNSALQIDVKNQDAWSLMGHVKYVKGDILSARQCYERTLSFVTDAKETHSVYLRLASIYLQEKKYQDAKNTYLMACKRSPSCVSWLGVGIACYRLGEFSEAEDALCEANILNNNDPEVWAYLSLVCLRTNRCLQAEQAYKYAIKLNLEEGPLLAEIHGEQTRYGFGNPGF